MSFQTSALVVTWVALLLLALVVSGLVRQVHALSSGAAGPGGRQRRLGIRPGSPAPAADRLGVTPPAVLLFLSEDCRTCADMLDEAVRAPTDGVALHALYAGPAPAGSAAGGGNGSPVVHGEQADLFERYDAIATPFAVVIDSDGRVARSGPVGSRAALRAVLGGAP